MANSVVTMKTPTKNIHNTSKHLRDENRQLKSQLDNALNDKEKLRCKFKDFVSAILHGADVSYETAKFDVNRFVDDDIPRDEWIEFIDVHIKRESTNTNSGHGHDGNDRLEELETRLTELSCQLAKKTAKEQRVVEAIQQVQRCNSLTDIRQKLWAVQCELSDTKALSHETVTADSHSVSLSLGCPTRVSPKKHSHQSSRGVNGPVITVDQIHLVPPKVRLPGDTHICRMDADLRHYVTASLNQHKHNGSDWRMLARRIGQSDNTISSWSNHISPMDQLWTEWTKSPGASIRLLHRHITSPDMKNVVLAAWMSKFYDVR